MRKIIIGLIGIVCGICVIVMAFNVRNNAEYMEINELSESDSFTSTPEELKVNTKNYSCSKEKDLSYGGDAYTGIQQAAAQAANNVMALDETVRQTNTYLETINANINKNTEALAHTSKQINDVSHSVVTQQRNQKNIYILIYNFGLCILIAIGLMMIVKYLGSVMDGIGEIASKRKQLKQASIPQPPMQPVIENYVNDPIENTNEMY